MPKTVNLRRMPKQPMAAAVGIGVEIEMGTSCLFTRL
jgi:hypothetical protein